MCHFSILPIEQALTTPYRLRFIKPLHGTLFHIENFPICFHKLNEFKTCENVLTPYFYCHTELFFLTYLLH